MTIDYYPFSMGYRYDIATNSIRSTKSPLPGWSLLTSNDLKIKNKHILVNGEIKNADSSNIVEMQSTGKRNTLSDIVKKKLQY